MVRIVVELRERDPSRQKTDLFAVRLDTQRIVDGERSVVEVDLVVARLSPVEPLSSRAVATSGFHAGRRARPSPKPSTAAAETRRRRREHPGPVDSAAGPGAQQGVFGSGPSDMLGSSPVVALRRKLPSRVRPSVPHERAQRSRYSATESALRPRSASRPPGRGMVLLFGGAAHALDDEGAALTTFSKWRTLPVRDTDDPLPIIGGQLRIPRGPASPALRPRAAFRCAADSPEPSPCATLTSASTAAKNRVCGS